MTERPILFSAPMVRAILAGAKTQTRRAIKAQGLFVSSGANNGHGVVSMTEAGIREVCCPYGQPGDRLWVRETFYCDHAFYPDGTPPRCYWDGAKPRESHTPEQMAKERADMLEAMYYRADGEPNFEGAEGPTPWRPSIHMPRWASRITLEVTGVRVERLQDISEADAVAEGIERGVGFPGWYRHSLPGDSIGLTQGCLPGKIPTAFPRLAYRALWESINGPGSWDANPWVWVVEFKRVG